MTDTDDVGEAARTFAAGIAVAKAVADGGVTEADLAAAGLDDRDLERAREALAQWAAAIHAPKIEVRRAWRRLESVVPAVPAIALGPALADPDPRRAAKRIVEVCAARDRDFGWDIPLRDVARAMLEAGLRARRAAAQRRGVAGPARVPPIAGGGPSL